MNSLGESCRDLKTSYDACFNLWFAEKFLPQAAAATAEKSKHAAAARGEDDSPSMCEPIFILYKKCVREAIAAQKIDLAEVDKEILGTDNEKQRPPPPSPDTK